MEDWMVFDKPINSLLRTKYTENFAYRILKWCYPNSLLKYCFSTGKYYRKKIGQSIYGKLSKEARQAVEEGDTKQL